MFVSEDVEYESFCGCKCVSVGGCPVFCDRLEHRVKMRIEEFKSLMWDFCFGLCLISGGESEGVCGFEEMTVGFIWSLQRVFKLFLVNFNK